MMKPAALLLCLALGCGSQAKRGLDEHNRGIILGAKAQLAKGNKVGPIQGDIVRTACEQTPMPECAELLAMLPPKGE